MSHNPQHQSALNAYIRTRREERQRERDRLQQDLAAAWTIVIVVTVIWAIALVVTAARLLGD